jgi:hypothetical protein
LESSLVICDGIEHSQIESVTWARQRLETTQILSLGRTRHYRPSEIQPRHWRLLASRAGSSGLWEKMQEMAAMAQPGSSLSATNFLRGSRSESSIRSKKECGGKQRLFYQGQPLL